MTSDSWHVSVIHVGMNACVSCDGLLLVCSILPRKSIGSLVVGRPKKRETDQISNSLLQTKFLRLRLENCTCPMSDSHCGIQNAKPTLVLPLHLLNLSKNCTQGRTRLCKQLCRFGNVTDTEGAMSASSMLLAVER